MSYCGISIKYAAPYAAAPHYPYFLPQVFFCYFTVWKSIEQQGMESAAVYGRHMLGMQITFCELKLIASFCWLLLNLDAPIAASYLATVCFSCKLSLGDISSSRFDGVCQSRKRSLVILMQRLQQRRNNKNKLKSGRNHLSDVASDDYNVGARSAHQKNSLCSGNIKTERIKILIMT